MRLATDFGSRLAVAVCIAVLILLGAIGCGDTDAEDEADEWETLGEIEEEDGKSDNIRDREVAWRIEDTYRLAGTTAEGTSEVVTAEPKVRVRSNAYIVDVSDYPVELEIEARGRLTTKKMNFAAYSRPHEDAGWEQFVMYKEWEDEHCVCRDSYCLSMGGPPDECMEMTTFSTRHWRYKDVVIEDDQVAVESPEPGVWSTDYFDNPYGGETGWQLKIVPIPFGSWFDLEGEYDYQLTVECFGVSCNE